jgi:hypothetical protein
MIVFTNISMVLRAIASEFTLWCSDGAKALVYWELTPVVLLVAFLGLLHSPPRSRDIWGVFSVCVFFSWVGGVFPL